MFNRLYIFTSHVKTNAAGEMADARLVREGFNVWAFVFGPFWALYHRCWLFAAMLFGYTMVIGMCTDQQLLNPASIAVLQFGLMMLSGFLANDALRDSLHRRGFKDAGVVTGDKPVHAEQRFFDSYVSATDA